MLIWLVPATLLESLMARRSEPLPGSLLSARFVTGKMVGTMRSSSASRTGKHLRERAVAGWRRGVDRGERRIEENHMVVSPVLKASAVQGRPNQRADRAPGRIHSGGYAIESGRPCARAV